MLKAAIDSFLSTKLLCKIILIDNSPTNDLQDITDHKNSEYIHVPSNPGFGAGHNMAMQMSVENADYFLVLNPDIYFDGSIIEEILKYLDLNTDIGVIMPNILYPDGRTQYLAKLLPTPMDFIIRRFIPFKSIKKKMADRFELRKSNYNMIMDVPFLSGCFMIFRTNVMKDIEGFDENIFMYTEDIDICRRVIDSGYRSVFYPMVSVYHDHEMKSFTSIRTMKVYFKSAFYYFNKWGWFFDRQRSSINKNTLQQLK